MSGEGAHLDGVVSSAARSTGSTYFVAQQMTNISLDEQPLPDDEDDASAPRGSFGTLATLDVGLDTGGGLDGDDAQFILQSSHSAEPARSLSAPAGTAAVADNPRSPSSEQATSVLDSSGRPEGAALPSDDSTYSKGTTSLGSNIDAKLSNLLRWGERTFRSTKQMVREQLGSAWRTVDAELEVQVALLKDTQHKYVRLVALTAELGGHLQSVVETQEKLSTHLAELAIKSPELHDDFRLNADSQNAVAKNGRKLIVVLNAFIASMRTLCNKTINDTLMTFGRYQNARLAFDACRHDYETIAHERNSPGMQSKVEAAKAEFEANKATFERLREDVMIKLRLLDENKVKVMHRQLIMYHAAVVSYFSGDQDQLDATLSQFNIKEGEMGQPSPALK